MNLRHHAGNMMRLTLLATALLPICIVTANDKPNVQPQDPMGSIQHDRSAVSEKAFGPADPTITIVPASEFAPAYDESGGLSVEYSTDIRGWVAKTGGTINFLDFVGPVSLTAGASLQAMYLEACDTSSSGQITLVLTRCDVGSDDSCTTLGTVETGQSATPGCVLNSVSISENINNFLYRYNLLVVDTDSSIDTKFRSVELWWQRQMSPAPGTATFGDVPTSHTFYQGVESLASSGITGGCGGDNFCPDETVTRGQMAAFLSRALGLHFSH